MQWPLPRSAGWAGRFRELGSHRCAPAALVTAGSPGSWAPPPGEAGPLVVEVARALLGWRLISDVGLEDGDASLDARIMETEAYGSAEIHGGPNDPASHAFRGPTSRNRSMFGPSGCLYVYRSYGIHWCANVVVEPEGSAAAVLLRAAELSTGNPTVRRLMGQRRPKARCDTDWANGPGKLCAALAITGEHDGLDLFDPASPLRLVPPEPGSQPRGGAPAANVTPRIGISKAVDLPWRFTAA